MMHEPADSRLHMIDSLARIPVPAAIFPSAEMPPAQRISVRDEMFPPDRTEPSARIPPQKMCEPARMAPAVIPKVTTTLRPTVR
jgi:hypothetical protein